MKIKNIEEALGLFIDSASKQIESNENGDYKIGNKCYDDLVIVTNYLKRTNSIKELRKLLDNKHIGVRLWSATYLLRDFEEEAKQTLREIVSLSHPVHSFTAEVTLSEWSNGSLAI